MPTTKIKNKTIGDNYPVYIVAEISANHAQKYENAEKLVHLAKECGADAIKIQTYTADTLTIDCNNDYFTISDGLWRGQTLYSLYRSAYTPWEWVEPLMKLANDIDIALISTVYDNTSVDFLEKLGIPAYKIASFELNDIPLIRYVASKNKPMIMSTGMASLKEIQNAVKACLDNNNNQIILLKCTSAYPAPIEEMNLFGMSSLLDLEGVPNIIGLSDHSLGIVAPIVATALGAKLIEKHFTLDRSCPTPDSEFSLEPKEFAEMVKCIKEAEKSLGTGLITVGAEEQKSMKFRRSLFVIKDMHEGDIFTFDNVRSIRPSDGMPPFFLDTILGHRANCNIERGTPLRWKIIRLKDEK